MGGRLLPLSNFALEKLVSRKTEYGEVGWKYRHGGECSLFEDGTSPSEKGWSSLNKIRSQVTTIPVACVHPTGCYGLQLSRTMEKKEFVFKFDIFSNQDCSKVGRGMGTNESRSCCIVIQIVNHKLAYDIR